MYESCEAKSHVVTKIHQGFVHNLRLGPRIKVSAMNLNEGCKFFVKAKDPRKKQENYILSNSIF